MIKKKNKYKWLAPIFKDGNKGFGERVHRKDLVKKIENYLKNRQVKKIEIYE